MSKTSSYQQKIYTCKIFLLVVLLCISLFVMISKKHDLAYFDAFLIVTTILILIGFSMFSNNLESAIEHFNSEENEDNDGKEESMTSSSTSHDTTQEYTNEKYEDTMLDKTLYTHLPSQHIVSYFSTMQFDSFESSKKMLRSLSQSPYTLKFNQYSKDGLKLTDEDSIIEYSQRDGVNLHNSIEVEGFPLSDLQNNFMKNFSISMFMKLKPFLESDYDFKESTFTLFETYSSNVMNSVALGVYLVAYKTPTDKVLSIKINYAGLMVFNVIPSSIVDRIFQNCHMFTFEKTVSSENEHYIRLWLDDGSDIDLLPLTHLTLSEIKYVTSSRQHVVLSTEPFVINKQVEGAQKENTKFRSLNVRLISLAIIKDAVSKHNHQLLIDMFQNMEEQRMVRLSRSYEEILTEKNELRTKFEKEKENASRCKLPEKICNDCPDVDWSDWNTILQGSDTCLTKIRNYCKNVDSEEEVEYKGAADKNLCRLVYISPPKPSPPQQQPSSKQTHPTSNTCDKPKITHNAPRVITSTGHETLDLGKYNFNEVSKELLDKPVGNLNKKDILKIVKSLAKTSPTDETPETDDEAAKKMDLQSMYSNLKNDYAKASTSHTISPKKYAAEIDRALDTEKTDDDYGTKAYNRIMQKYEETLASTSDAGANMPITNLSEDTSAKESNSFMSTLWKLFRK